MEKFICRKIRQLLLKLMALILCLASVPAAAVDGAARPTEGLCIHHPAHDAACGYQEETQAQPCNHVHDAACGYREPIGEVPCDQGCADADGDGQIDHAAGCAYRPAQEAQPCNHVHDAACGYQAAGTASPCAYAQAGCPYCVRAWDWVDPLGALTQAEQGWVLALPGVGPEQPLTRDAAASLLPAQINVTLKNGQQASLPITWDLSSIPEEGTSAGMYPVLASLADPTYALPQGDALSITLQAGGAQPLDSKLPSGDPPYHAHIVPGISPLGTTIHLFDYWIESQTADDSGENTQHYFLSKGINNGHALLFGNGMRNNQNNIGEWNWWTQSNAPYQGIVKSNLGNDGYPQLNLNILPDTDLTTQDGHQSLAYLFDPEIPVGGKASYPNVKGLLQVDEDGYYYYDSGENYAVYYPDGNSFVLYDHPGVKSDGAAQGFGNFFPFNAATEDPDTSGGGLMSTVGSTDPSINHYFGMHMSTRFIQLDGGKIGEDPVTYEFSGDDDVWVFIDGVLVADLGGIHDAASVKIDFSTGKITINDEIQEKTLGALLNTGSNTLADNTQHTLDFFYLERGNVDSHMVLKYNLVTQPESSLIKIDQLGNPVPEAEFSLYAADNLSTAIATGTTDREGRFIFLDPKDSTPLTIQELYEKYGKSEDDAGNNLIVEETDTPAGYRTIDQVGLYFCESIRGEVLLLSNSIWDKGAYAMPKVTVAASKAIALLETEGEEAISLENDPLMFAVVYQKQGEDDWRPVYGDPIHGWHVEPDSTWASVLRAAKANPYVFQLTSNGSYQVTIENLPGDIETYYYICNDETTAKYTVAYYYTEAENLDEATEENTWRIDSLSETHPLERSFSMDLFITNIKNRLLVQKVDQAGKPLAGAEFTLYAAENATVENGAVTIKADAAAYDTLQTEGAGGPLGLEGGGLFPTQDKVLENGEYYLVETGAPAGYKPNPAAVHILVDDTGVYADAGQPGDGISVLRGVGSVIKSMVQFAAKDDVDATLQDIKAALATSVTWDETKKAFTVSGEGIHWDSEGQDVLHLQYQNANELLDYGLYDAPATVTLDDVTLETDTGWSKLLIRQCYQHDPATGSSLKTDLGEQDITDLFSGTVTVRVANDRAEGLTIAKTVTGNTAPPGEKYAIEVNVEDDDGTPISGRYDTVSGAGESGFLTFTEGKATVSLQAGESLTILGLPEGASYTVTEAQSQEQAYTTTVSVNGAGKQGHEAAGTLTVDGQTVRFINAYPSEPDGSDPGNGDEPWPEPQIPRAPDLPPPTGDGGEHGWPWALLAASLAALALAWKRCAQARFPG